MQYVVFGVNGYIGSYIFQQLEKDKFNILGTSRRSEDNDKIISYDIREDNIDNLMTKVCDEARIAIICIAESNIDRCYENYAQAYEINVIKTKKLIHELITVGFRIIYFSSDNVFDGKCNGEYTEDSPTSAINKYGTMKEEMEHFLQNKPEVCVLRIPKVVSIHKARQNVLTEWAEQIMTGYIRCIKGNKLSFVYIDDVYQACLLVAQKGMQGIYNVSGDITYSRTELARKFFDMLGEDEIEIKECDMNEFSFKDYRPLDLGMSNLKFKEATNYQFATMDYVLDQYIKNSILG